jgi:hypothetical protein
MIWSLAGIAGSLILAALAWTRSRASATPFERDLYAMTVRTHRWSAGLGLALAVLFAFSLRLTVAAVPLAAIAIAVAIFYAATFARGYTGEDE